MKIALYLLCISLMKVSFADNSHSYEDMKIKLTDGIDSIINQLTDNSEHLKDDFEDDFGWDFEEVNKDKSKDDMEMQFFTLHDYDHNGQLDGLELLKSMIHEHGDHSQQTKEETLQRISSAEGVVDLMLRERDLNQNGQLSYAEFKYSSHAAKR